MIGGLTCVPPNAKLGVPAFDPRYEGLLRSVYMFKNLSKVPYISGNPPLTAR
jgi:hypothetical protein